MEKCIHSTMFYGTGNQLCGHPKQIKKEKETDIVRHCLGFIENQNEKRCPLNWPD